MGVAEADQGLLRWRVVRGCVLHGHAYAGGEYVVYHPGSGDTHLLEAVGAAVLRGAQVPGSLPEIGDRAAAALAVEIDDDFRRTVARLISHFERLGLVEQCGE